MKHLTVAAASLNQTPLDWTANLSNIRAAIALAKKEGVRLLCLPELCVTGYGCEDAFSFPSVQQRAFSAVVELEKDTAGMAVALGFPLSYRGDLYSAAAFYADGSLCGIVCKQFLAREGIHYEPRWFRAWTPGMVDSVGIGERKIPCGDIYFKLMSRSGAELRIGFEICEDAWSSARPGARLAQCGVDLILNPSVSHFAFKKYETRVQFVQEGSRAFGAGYVYANLVGNEAGRAIYDGGNLIASLGEIRAAGERFSFESTSMCTAVIDVELVRTRRQKSFGAETSTGGSGRERFASLPSEVEIPLEEIFTSKALKGERVLPVILSKEEEFAHAVALGLFDYMRKSRSKGFVLSLSGGADSAAVAVLVRLMTEFALRVLGEKRFFERLSYWPELTPTNDTTKLMKSMLCAVYQATAMSSIKTREAAAKIAEATGAEFCTLEVEEIVQAYRTRVEKSLNRKLTWKEDDVTLQNIQARVRGPSVWMFANIRQALLLATSNRSEVAVGYTTMDGDTCGGLSPIAGIDKAFLLQWLRWMERSGMKEYGAIPELASITSQAPTAELRPQDQVQTDEADLMPYPVLDEIERLAIRDKKGPHEIYQALKDEHSPPELKSWIEKFFTLWCRNQWKRERYAPSFHLDEENLDPRTWCRFPILSGGFEAELKELKKL